MTPGLPRTPSCHLSYIMQSAALFLPVRTSLSPTAYVTPRPSHLSRRRFSFSWREVTVGIWLTPLLFEKTQHGLEMPLSWSSYSRGSRWGVDVGWKICTSRLSQYIRSLDHVAHIGKEIISHLWGLNSAHVTGYRL